MPAPRSWPHPCSHCGRATDPLYAEPWDHEAEGYRLRHDLSRPDTNLRAIAESSLRVWEYKDARLAGDGAAADAALQALLDLVRRLRATDSHHWLSSSLFTLVWNAAAFDDIHGAADALLIWWYPWVDTRDVDGNSGQRADARSFVTACILVLEREASIGHPREAELDAAMRDVATRAEGILTPEHEKGRWRVREIRALRTASLAMAAASRSSAAVASGVPAGVSPADIDRPVTSTGLETVAVPMTERVRSALEAMELHDDSGPVDALIRDLGSAGNVPRLLHLLRARRHLAVGAWDAALGDLESADRSTDGLARRRGRRSTSADASLARLLVWRALLPEAAPERREADALEAVRLARRRCRPWRRPGAGERVVLREALAARDAVTGGGTTAQRQRAWRRAVDGPWSVAERARLAQAWTAWAVDTGDAELAAEAYGRLVALVPLDAAGRHGPSAKHKVIAAAQEHTEDAGYWLARTRRYREAVVALEQGRAVGLSEIIGRGEGAAAGPSLRVDYADISATAADGALVYVAAAKAGGYALIVAGRHDPQFMELPKLDRATVASLVGTMLPGTDGGEPRAVRELTPSWPSVDVFATGLKMLWDNGIRDLTLLHARGRIVTLIPVGLLGLLPLHAAGEPGRPGDRYTEWRHAGHFSAVRYVPNARSLRRCRITLDELPAAARLLAVDVPDGHGLPPEAHLRHVTQETNAVVRDWTGSAAVRHACTWQTFREEAGPYAVWHLACHGAAQPASILDSSLAFADRNVTLHTLRRELPGGPRRLAVLSACETNLVGVNVPNEAVGLPTVLLQLGFAGVVASSWKVDDLATAYLMTAFYRLWCHEGQEPAVALNRAQQWLRAAGPDDLTALLPGTRPGGDGGPQPYVNPRYWAAFSYTGV